MPSKIRRRGDGKYEIAAYVGYDDQGKQVVKRKTVTARNEREAAKRQAAFEMSVQQGSITLIGKLKLSVFAKQWFEDHCRKNLAPKTQCSYRNHLNNRILPALGHLDINQVRPQHIIRFINDLQERGARFDGRDGKVSQDSVCYSFRVLSSMLQDAVQWQVIPTNPCKRVEPPKASYKKVRIMDEDSIGKMIVALENEPLKYRAIIMLGIDSGLRLGEMMGLKWQDIDLESSMLSVTKANQALPGRGVFTKCPKNETSVRDIALSDSTVSLLQTYQKEQTMIAGQLGEKWVDEG